MTMYFTSDTHFNHSNIIKYCNRPFVSTTEMNRVMIERWNAVVRPGDVVYHLGDFAMGAPIRWADFLQALNGKKILIKGNHDKNLTYMKDKVGFDEVYEELTLETTQGTWWLSHHPVKTPRRLLCGHIHDKWRRLGFIINVGVDMWDFTPRTIEELLAAPQDNPEYQCRCGAVLKRLADNTSHRSCSDSYV